MNAVLLMLGVLGAPLEPADFYLKGGGTIVFLGDSITQGGLYVEYIEAFLATRFPEKRFRIVYAGLSSETVSGTSEPDHSPPRPWVHDRFTRDAASQDADVIVACYGMNDGNYHPFEAERFEKYKAGVRRVIDRVKSETRARLVLVTPPPFDPYRRQVGDPDAVRFGYKFPAADYDETLARYSEWLLTLRADGFVVADAHSLANEHLRRRRAEKASFFLAGDAVHPGPTGHWLIAEAILSAWGAPAAVPASAPEITAGPGETRVRWTTALPMPMDPRWDRASIALEKVAERWNRHVLKVEGLTGARYEIRHDGKKVLDATREALAAGIDILPYADFPTCKSSLEVLDLVRKKRSASKDDAPKIEARIRELCAPRAYELSIVPAR